MITVKSTPDEVAQDKITVKIKENGEDNNVLFDGASKEMMRYQSTPPERMVECQMGSLFCFACIDVSKRKTYQVFDRNKICEGRERKKGEKIHAAQNGKNTLDKINTLSRPLIWQVYSPWIDVFYKRILLFYHLTDGTAIMKQKDCMEEENI